MNKRLAMAVLGVLLLCTLTGCVGIHWRVPFNTNRVEGSGSRVTQSYEMEGFDSVEIGELNAKLYLSQGTEYAVSIEMDDNLFQHVDVRVTGSRLEIETGRFWLRPSHDVRVYITAPQFVSLDIAGACEFVMTEPLTGESLNVHTAGAVEGTLPVDLTGRLFLDLAGAGSLHITGSVDQIVADVAGAASIDAKSCIAREASVSISGAGSMSVHSTDSLDVTIAGVGELTYYGNPANVNKSIAGLGSIKPGSER